MRRRNPVWWPLTVSVPSLGRRKDRLGLRLWGGQGRVRPGPGLGTEKLSLTAQQYYEWTAGRQAGLHYLSLVLSSTTWRASLELELELELEVF